MKTTFLKPSSRQGMTYMTVVVTMIVLGTMLAAFISLVSVQSSLATRSQNWNRGVPIVEAGIEEAMAHLNKNGIPDASGTVNVANLSAGTDGWGIETGGSISTGPWYKWGYMDGDWYKVIIDRWDGTTTNFPQVAAACYVQNNAALTGHKDDFYRMTNASISGRSDSIAFLAAINVSQFPDLGQGSQYSRRVVTCGLTNNPFFTKALVAKHGIDLNGNNVFTDSYDSRNPAYSTNGRWDASKHRDHGDVASNDTVTNSINVGNANVWGHIATGPMGTIAVGPNGKVGDAAWQAGNVNGIKPGFSTDDMNVEFPDVVMPTPVWNAMPAGGTVDGVSYNYVFNSSGNYIKPVGSGNISGKILINAPNVRIRVDTGWTFTGQDYMSISSNANVTIYLNCASADIEGQGIVNSAGRPDQCYIYGTSLLTTLDMGGNGETTAAVYAPYANVKLHGGGNSDQDFSGSIMANSFTFTGHYSVHYDEALGRVGTWRGFTITSWDEK